MTRTGIGARLRFEILKRDNFRCQYCGAAAPNCGSPWCESRETLFANLDSYSAEAANDFCSADDIAAVAGRA